MSTSTRWLPTTLAVALALACSNAGPTGLADATNAAGPVELGVVGVDAAGQSAEAAIDVSGEWEWRREETFTIPDQFAFVFGFQPEGPVTHFRCEVEGVITLVQTGGALSGTEMETWSLCETRGGQIFPQPGLGVSIPIPEGRVTSRTVELVVGDAEVICPIHAVIQEVEGGVGQAMRGTGRCWVPGHPKSQAPEGSPFDLAPPPAGTEKIVVWEATRPAS